MSTGLDPSDLAVNVTCVTSGGGGVACNSAPPGSSVRVAVSYTYNMVWPLTFTSIPLASTVEMRIE
jgi:hypothetical protein